jgi:cysteine synthase B
MNYPTIEDAIGKTPLVALQRIGAADNRPWQCHAGQARRQQPGGFGQGPPALSMIRRAQERGEIKPGDTLIEATSGNTGIALAMAAAIKGYRMVLIMPEDLSIERAQTMKAFGAELMLTPKSGGMEYARDLAEQMQREGKGRGAGPVCQRRQPAHPLRDHRPEIWADTQGRVTHFVSAMGTTGTITGVSRFSRKRTPPSRSSVRSLQEGSRIPGIRKWPQEYLPKIYDPAECGRTGVREPGRCRGDVPALAREEGIFAGISAAGACWVAQEIASKVE